MPDESITSRKWYRRIRFGYDIAISYSRKDAVIYAEGLAAELTARKYHCFVDQYGAPASQISENEEERQEVPREVLKKIRTSSMLVVLGTPGAVHSGPMRDEIEAFVVTGRKVVPIEAAPEFENSIWYPDIRGIARTPEVPENIVTGKPSSSVIQRVENAFEYFRRDQVLNMTFWLTVAAVALVVGGGYLAVRYQARLVDEAKLAEKAAEHAATEADGKAKAAQERERVASDNANRQEKIAHALQAASQSQMLLREQPERLYESTALAIQAMAQLDSLGVHSREASTAMYGALALLPQLKKVTRIDAATDFMKLSPDGAYIAFAPTLRSAKLQQLEAHRIKEMPLSGQFDPDYKEPTFVFSPDSRRLAVVSEMKPDWSVEVFSTAAPQKASAAIRVPERPEKIIFNDEGVVLAVAMRLEVRIYDAMNGKQIGQPLPHVNAIAFGSRRSSNLVAISGYDYGLLLWNFRDNTTAPTTLHSEPDSYLNGFRSLAFSPTGEALAGCCDSQGWLRIWNLSTGASNNTDSSSFLIHIRDGGELLHWEETGRRLGIASASSFSSSGVTIVDVKSSTSWQTGDWLGDQGDFHFRKGDNQIVTAGNNGTASVWEVFTGKEQVRMPHSTELQGKTSVLQAVWANQAQEIETLSADKKVRVWGTSPAEPIATGRGQGTRAQQSFFTPDGRSFFWVEDEQLRFHDVERDKQLPPVALGEKLNGNLLASESGRYLVAYSGREVCLWKQWTWNSNTKPTCVHTTDAIQALALSPNEKYLATGDHHHRITIWQDWNLRAPQRSATLQYEGEIGAIAFDQMGKYIAVGGASKIFVWEWTQHFDPPRVTLPHKNVTSLSFNGDGRVLLSAGGGSAFIWEWQANQQTPKDSFEKSFLSARFDPTYRFVVAASLDFRRPAQVWGLETGKPEELAVIPETEVYAAEFNKDAKYVATSAKGPDIIRAWLWRPSDLIRQACERLPNESRPQECNCYLSDHQH